MEYLYMGYLLMAAAIYYLVKAVMCVFKKVMDKKRIIANTCLMANFTIFGRMFMTIQEKPELANGAKGVIVLLGILNILFIIVLAIIMLKRKIKSRKQT